MIDVNTIFPCESSEEERERGVIDVLFLSFVWTLCYGEYAFLKVVFYYIRTKGTEVYCRRI